jgi:TolB-like protein
MTTEPERAPLSTEVSRLESEGGSHAHHALVHFRVFEQLKQRNVFRVAVLYLVVCWLILEPVHVVFHMLEVPAWANRLVVMLMAVGFPAVVIFAWVYEITPEGLKPTVEVPHDQSIRRLTGRRLDRAIIAVLAAALAYFVADKFWISQHFSAPQAAASTAQDSAARVSAAPATAAAFAPPPHSLAVLPFVNISGDKEQEYFSDGLTEELLNSLARINELQVAGRTSSFYFKGEHTDLTTIARKLNVAAVLEGSVRRSTHTVRITAQLINAVTGFHLWSAIYDRDLGDVLKLQTEIASAVASSLKVTLLGDLAAKVELGGTRNPAAFDAYLHASKASSTAHEASDFQMVIAAYTDAISLDPGYALAFAARSIALSSVAEQFATGPAIRKGFDEALADAHKAIALAPELGEGHLALALLFEASFDFARADEEYGRAMDLAPGNPQVLRIYGRFATWMGRDAGLAAARRVVVLDPLDPRSHYRLGQALLYARRYGEAIAAYNDTLALDSANSLAHGFRGIAYYMLGNFQGARASCEIEPDFWVSQWCLAVTYDKLGRHTDAEAVLAKYRTSLGDANSYEYGTIYAQWGNTAKALELLENSVRVRDVNLGYVKTDPLIDPLRKEPRFQAIERALKFPN